MRPLTAILITAAAIASEPAVPEPADMRELVARLRSFEAVVGTIEREHVAAPARDRLWAGAFAGMAAACDPASRYLDPAQAALHQAQTQTATAGFGVDLDPDGPGAAVATRIVPGSPAAQAGLRCGDRLLAEPAPTILGERLEARLERTGAVVALERTTLADDGIGAAGELGGAGHGIGYIRVERFTANTAAAFAAHRRAIGVLPLVIDLRGNGGGDLPAAVACTDALVEPGQVVVEQTARNPGRIMAWRAPPASLPVPASVVVLVDGGTASAAEALAGALRDHKAAVVVGARTRGKGSVQQLIALDGGGALLLTVAALVRPGGAPLSDGIFPDAAVASTPADGWRSRNDPAAPDAALTQAIAVVRARSLGR